MIKHTHEGRKLPSVLPAVHRADSVATNSQKRLGKKDFLEKKRRGPDALVTDFGFSMGR